MNIKIGARIKALRKRDGVTQEKLADALGVTPQAVSKWESETGYPDLEYLMPIANFFNITLDELFGHDLAENSERSTNTASSMTISPATGRNPDSAWS